MKYTWFLVVLLLVAVGVSAQKELQDESEVEEKDKKSKSKSNSESKSPGKISDNTQVQKPEFLVTPDDKLELNSRNQENFYSDAPEGNQIPLLGFSYPRTGTQGQNFFLSDGAGRYNVQLQSFQQSTPPHFNTAVGAISAHLLSNRRPNQEYIPYPPNGDPYNYPAYRGYPHATEPPVVKAYETANNVNYNAQPSANFDQYTPRRLFPSSPYHQGFPNQFENFGLGFYNNPYLFNDPGFYSGLRRNYDSSFDDRFRDQARTKPIK